MTAKCCDNPTNASEAPTTERGKAMARCGNCGKEHGELTVKQADKLFMGDA